MTLVIPNGIIYEPFAIGHLDANGRDRLELDREFPLAIKARSYEPRHEYPLSWHERLEIFVPVAGYGQVRMGEKLVGFESGDVVVVENVKLHGLASFQGPYRRAFTITFMPELVHIGNPPLLDFGFLSPFYTHVDGHPSVVQHADGSARPIHGAISNLLGCYFRGASQRPDQAGCKVYLLELLYQLSRHFPHAQRLCEESVRQQYRARRLGKVFDHLHDNFAGRITLTEAAAMAGMSVSCFTTFFKKLTGTTLISYVTQIRLAHARRLLRESDQSISEIAAVVGFPDQSYFDRIFKKGFHRTPREYRSEHKGQDSRRDFTPAHSERHGVDRDGMPASPPAGNDERGRRDGALIVAGTARVRPMPVRITSHEDDAFGVPPVVGADVRGAVAQRQSAAPPVRPIGLRAVQE